MSTKIEYHMESLESNQWLDMLTVLTDRKEALTRKKEYDKECENPIRIMVYSVEKDDFSWSMEKYTKKELLEIIE